MRKRGSAIIIAMFSIALVGSVAFSVARIIFLENDTAGAYENGTAAFLAAESGLEEAFLRYRDDQNVELPLNNDLETTKVKRTNLKTLQTQVTLSSNPLASNSDQIYDVNIESKADFIGSDNPSGVTSCNASSPNCILRDEVKSFKLNSTGSSQDINFSFVPLDGQPLDPPVLTNDNCVVVEVKLIGEQVGAGELDERKKLFYNNNNALCNYSGVVDVSDNKSNIPYTLVGGSATITNLIDNIWKSANLSADKLELLVRPIGANIAFKITKSDSSSVWGGATTIQSTGYFGGVRRFQKVDLDRQSGTLYDLFDYVIYKAN